ncbi:MAG: MEDS domain-containing protein [Gemmatimonadota bacterium]
MDEAGELLDIVQAARFLNVSETSLRRWTNEGRLACLRVGRRRERRFRQQDLLAFLENQPAAGTEGAAGSGSVQEAAGLAYPSGTHLAAFYASDDGQVSQAVAFIADGLRPFSTTFVLAGASARAAILAHLERGRGSVRTDTESGRLVLANYGDSVAAQLDFLESAFIAAMRTGARSLRLVADLRTFADVITPDVLPAYEAAYDHLIAHRFPVVTLCQYDVRHFSGLDVFKALQGHPNTLNYPADRLLA